MKFANKILNFPGLSLLQTILVKFIFRGNIGIKCSEKD
jgi:hypothetical protein